MFNLCWHKIKSFVSYYIMSFCDNSLILGLVAFEYLMRKKSLESDFEHVHLHLILTARKETSSKLRLEHTSFFIYLIFKFFF